MVADAFNHGWTQLWSQDRRYEWTNFYQPSSDHFSGGYGRIFLDHVLQANEGCDFDVLRGRRPVTPEESARPTHL